MILNISALHFKKSYNFTYLYKSYIHNQSYIILNTKYTKILQVNKKNKIIIDNQNDLILNLKKDNNKLLNRIQDLNKQLLERDRFLNLNFYSKFPFNNNF
jgi:hypothetical protein